MVSNLGLWPASHVVAGTRVSSTVRRVLMQVIHTESSHVSHRKNRSNRLARRVQRTTHACASTFDCDARSG